MTEQETLRQLFAATAMQELLASYLRQDITQDDTCGSDFMAVAKLSWTMADAMLATENYTLPLATGSVHDHQA